MLQCHNSRRDADVIGPLQDLVTWYGINYTGTQMTQWDFQNKGKSGWRGKNSFVFKVPLRHLRPSVIYSVPCDRILQRAHCHGFRIIQPSSSSLALLASNDIPMCITHKSTHLRKKVRNMIEFDEVRNGNNFPFNHKDSTYREAVIPKISCSALKMAAL